MTSRAADCYRWANREGWKVGPNAHRVLIELLTYADLKDGLCFPSRKSVAANVFDTSKPTRSQLEKVTEAMGALEKAGLIRRGVRRRENGSTTSNNTELLLPPATEGGTPRQKGGGTPPQKGARTPPERGRPEVSSGSLQDDLSTEAGDPVPGEVTNSWLRQKFGDVVVDEVWAGISKRYWHERSALEPAGLLSIPEAILAELEKTSV